MNNATNFRFLITQCEKLLLEVSSIGIKDKILDFDLQLLTTYKTLNSWHKRYQKLLHGAKYKL